jgi:hypothetical protein
VENIKRFLRESYSDAALMALRDKAELGELRRANVNHCLLGCSDAGYTFHSKRFRTASAARMAEREFMALSIGWPWGKKACKRLGWLVLPLIDAEIERRGLITLQCADLERIAAL